uniref:Lipase 8 n=1 Tax=Lygus hesperus TaxID=30085 RepID=A0A0A9XFK1_LYGHE
MSRRRDKGHEPLGPVYLLRSVKDQVQLFQEKRGILPEENNFVNLIGVIITQCGQAMYAVFTMFLALIPAMSIFIYVVHFVLDRVLDIVTTRRNKELWVKGGIFIVQLIGLFILLKFILGAIFAPIFSMQITIISKMLFFDEE